MRRRFGESLLLSREGLLRWQWHDGKDERRLQRILEELADLEEMSGQDWSYKF